MQDMQGTEDPIFERDVYAMLANRNSSKTLEEIRTEEESKEDTKSIESSSAEKREILRIKNNLFREKQALSSKNR